MEGREAPWFLMVLSEPEIKKNHRPNARAPMRIIIIAKRILLPKILFDLLLISSGIVIRDTTVKIIINSFMSTTYEIQSMIGGSGLSRVNDDKPPIRKCT